MAQSGASATAHLNSDPAQGLSETEAERRLRQYGPNRLPEAKRRGPLLMLLGQFGDFMILVLIAAELGFCLVRSSVVFFGVELEQWGLRRGWLYRG